MDRQKHSYRYKSHTIKPLSITPENVVEIKHILFIIPSAKVSSTYIKPTMEKYPVTL